ncbi:unnamed protein product [Callosobruchus maculatus]|uniref:Uncharacterized protein n=1 Tax=Callosobruchus maculatus TaxID=64391 RepID=A0A653D2G7_CALMS|nr:unnamed protein product [Callosobruchus maculatus]
MQIRIDATNATYQKPNVELVDLEPPPRTAGFLSHEWSIKADVPFNHCSVILLTAFHANTKKIAVFVALAQRWFTS